MAEQKKTGKVILWVALGCGGLLLLLGVTCATIAYFGKKKLDQVVAEQRPEIAEAIKKGDFSGVQTATGHVVAAGAVAYGAMALSAIPVEERAEYSKVLERLAQVGAQLSNDDVQAIQEALDTVQNAHSETSPMPSAEEAREYLEALRPIAEKYEPR